VTWRPLCERGGCSALWSCACACCGDFPGMRLDTRPMERSPSDRRQSSPSATLHGRRTRFYGCLPGHLPYEEVRSLQVTVTILARIVFLRTPTVHLSDTNQAAASSTWFVRSSLSRPQFVRSSLSRPQAVRRATSTPCRPPGQTRLMSVGSGEPCWSTELRGDNFSRISAAKG
jgi:hypothetical protein